MLRDLKQGDLDVVMAVTDTPPVTKPRHVWMRQAVWVRSDATRVDPNGPVPLVSYGEDCACQRVAVAALRQAGRGATMSSRRCSLTSLAAAVSAGFGVLVMPRGAGAAKQSLHLGGRAAAAAAATVSAGSTSATAKREAPIDELADYLEADLRAEPQPPNCETGATVSELRAASGA